MLDIISLYQTEQENCNENHENQAVISTIQLPSNKECESAYQEYKNSSSFQKPCLYRSMYTDVDPDLYQQLHSGKFRVIQTNYGYHVSPNQFCYRSEDGNIGFVIRTSNGKYVFTKF